MARALMAALLLAVAKPTPTALPPLKQTYYLLYTRSSCDRLFGISGTRSVVSSAYAYEINLLDGSPPVADIDCMFYGGIQKHIRLPGFTTDHYRYRGAVLVIGSGWVQKFATPNGGRFAFLHMWSLTTSFGFAPVVGPPLGLSWLTLNGPVAVDGDENTARSVGALATAPPPFTASFYAGNTVVGTSGWPTDPYYGNGSYGPADAHLCVLLDARAADWFYAVASGAHKKPPWRFPAKKWGAWTRGHKKPWITEWQHKSCAGKQRCLTWAASTWLHHEWLRGVKDHGNWYKRKGEAGYTKTRFARGCIFAWPRYHAAKARHLPC